MNHLESVEALALEALAFVQNVAFLILIDSQRCLIFLR